MDNSRRRSATATVPKAAIAKASTALQDLPEKPRENIPLREAMVVMETAIRSALDKGYTLEEVSAMLTQKGVEVNTASLKYYMSPSRRGKTLEPAKKRDSKPRRAPAATAQDPQPAVTEKAPAAEQRKAENVISYLLDESTTNGTAESPEPAETPEKKRGGRRSPSSTGTAAKAKPAARTKATSEDSGSSPHSTRSRKTPSTPSTRGRRKPAE